ncbi:hypothetical protein GSY74_05630 [Sulfurovum sp. bin170]|uniref:hypothetical protein n=1 Tax=Sulfurovum sp. bin170 TaxID=2695268 RepID=UPI0013E06220|nr:hypothetical protein [Sulfurovum sp. bin170]NEW60758.1 hypothetical protein [Sulfurovum sp. bin170]
MSNFIKNFLQELDNRDIDYLHWKSNTNIEKALIGEDDLDILVDPKKKYEVYQLFKELNILRAYSEKDSWQNEIFHYFGVDIEAQKMIHIHLHFLLEVGYDFDKSVNLPIIENYMASKEHYKKSVYIPSVENEYILLIIRLILKNGLTPFLMLLPTGQWSLYRRQKSKKGIIQGSAYREYLDLRERSSREKISESLDSIFSFVDRSLFYEAEQVIKENSSLIDYFTKSREMKKVLKPYSYHSAFVSFFKSLYRINLVRFGKVSKKRVKSKKIPANGGRIFAFVGGDGAGKSSNIEKLASTLGRHYFVETIHIGRPNRAGEPKQYFIGRQINNIGKLFIKLGLSNFGNALSLVGLAVERKQAFIRAQKVKSQGGIVILDRIPLEGVTEMDGPRVAISLGGKQKFLAKIEERLHRSIQGIDRLIVLKLNPQIALKRRPEDDPDKLLIRSGSIWKHDFSNRANTIVVDTENSFRYVEEQILKSVWSSINDKAKISELIGLAGTGKSTSRKSLQKIYPQAKVTLQNEKKGAYLLKNSYKYLKVYMKAKKIKYTLLRSIIKIDIFLHDLKSGEYRGDQQLILDQGSIFYTILLMIELPELEKIFLAKLAEVLYYYDEVIYLEAPVAVLCDRINSREQKHRVKNMDESLQREFLEKYIEAFDKILALCHSQGVRVHRIDSHKNGPNRVEEMVNGIMHQ